MGFFIATVVLASEKADLISELEAFQATTTKPEAVTAASTTVSPTVSTTVATTATTPSTTPSTKPTETPSTAPETGDSGKVSKYRKYHR